MQWGKLLSLVLVFLVSIIAVKAADYDITSVEVNGVSINVANPDAKTLYVERSETLDLKVELVGTGNVEDVRVRAEIEGYDDDISDRTSQFDIQPNLTYTKSLSLSVPNDIDSSEEYTLVITVADKADSTNLEIPLKIEEARHDLKISDVLLRPGSSIEAGKPLFVGVRVENLGAKKENDVKVSVTIPELGLSVADYLDRLYTEEQEDADSDTKNSAQLDDLFVTIPEDVVAGDYKLVVKLSYNRGREEISAEKTISVICNKGTGAGCLECSTTSGQTTCESGNKQTSNVEAIVSIDTTTQTIAQGEGAVYKVAFANLGKTAKVYSLNVAGINSWATARVDPASIVVAPGETGEMYAYVSANENAAEGAHNFKIQVKSAGSVIKEVAVEANVTGATNGFGWSNLRKGLMVTFIVLLVVLVVLGLIVAFGKWKKDDELVPEEPSTLEGQTYYNYPQY